MSILRAYQFQLRCKAPQERALWCYSGCMRWVWNQALAEQQRRHADGEKYAGYADMCKWLTAWRNAPGTAWLADAPNHPQQQVLKRLDESYKRFFAKTGGFPRFKSRGDDPVIRFPDAKQVALEAGRIKLPKLIWHNMERLSRHRALQPSWKRRTTLVGGPSGLCRPGNPL